MSDQSGAGTPNVAAAPTVSATPVGAAAASAATAPIGPELPSKERTLSPVIGVAIVIGLVTAFATSLWVMCDKCELKHAWPTIILFVAIGFFLMILLYYATPRSRSTMDNFGSGTTKLEILINAFKKWPFRSSGPWIFLGLGLAFWFSLDTLIKESTQFKLFSYLVPIIFLFIAIGVFLMVLLHYAVHLKERGIIFEATALGLPEGSIRAFIAIALIALVGVFGSFLFFETTSAQYRKVLDVKLVEAEVAAYRATLPTGFILLPSNAPKRAQSEPTPYLDSAKQAALEPHDYQVVFAESNAAQIDIAKQLLTMIVTVLTTVIGFYFGAKTAEQKTDADAARRNEILNAVRISLKAYNDAAASLQQTLQQLKTDAVANLPDADKQPVQKELTRIDTLVAALKSRADHVKSVTDNASADIKDVTDARDEGAKLVQEQTKLKTQIEQAAKDVKDPAVNDSAKRTAALVKVGAAS